VSSVLVVDDEPQIVRALSINLRARGYDVHSATTGADALRSAAKHQPELVILDLGLPDMDGVEVIHGIRGWSSAPILVLSGRSDSADKVDALDAGADDYITKPFGLDELMARLRAMARRAVPSDEAPAVAFGDVTVDLAARRVTTHREGESRREVKLTPTEWHLLEVLVRNPGRLLSQKLLLSEVWGPGYETAQGNLRLYMAQLRRKLEADPARPRHLITEPGMGYRFDPQPQRGAVD
jgi:two-component system KDP operon response regulator KdpE